jgi:hypothetical protein
VRDDKEKGIILPDAHKVTTGSNAGLFVAL